MNDRPFIILTCILTLGISSTPLSAQASASEPVTINENDPANLAKIVESPKGAFTCLTIDDENPRVGNRRCFGSCFADVNRDGLLDVIAGKVAHLNPGGDMTGKWPRIIFAGDVDVSLVADIDGDDCLDLIGSAPPDGDVYWLEADQPVAGAFAVRARVGGIGEPDHGNCEGSNLAQIEPGGRPEVLFVGDALYYFRIPDNPESGNWPRVRIARDATDQVWDVGDVDNDGDIDVAVIGTIPRYRTLKWYRNPGDGSADWDGYELGQVSPDENLYGADQIRLGDMNGDGRLDAAVTEAAPKGTTTCRLYLFNRGADPAQPWKRSCLFSAFTLNNLNLADMDGDGSLEIITAEHRGPKRLFILDRPKGGSSWVATLIDSGIESHDGAKPVDLDQDGDLDIVSIAYDQNELIHVWRNNARH